MEKELTSNNNNFLSSKYGLTEMPSENFINCYLQQHQNWDAAQNDQTDFFDSALSSIVSSPASVPQSSNGGEGVMIRELIGRLGSICDSGDVSPQSCIAATTTTTTTTTTAATNNNGSNSSANNSCYSTPLNSPPSSNFNIPTLIINSGNYGFPIQSTLGSLNADPGFVERAAKFSCFGTFNGGVTATANNNNNINSYNGNNNISCNNLTSSLEPVKLSRVNSGKKLGENNGDSREGSSVSEQNTGGGAETACGVKAAQNDGNSRKRKSGSKAKVKETSITKDDKAEVENDESKDKRSKIEDDKKENAGETNKEEAKAEPLKDYIHVRARRGQATDSHSLAERVRREKISERMKFLQDLVPGCNKVTGKATVLDEIINYVQSLQRQVEFLSMKLSTVNPRMEFNMEALLSKDMLQSRGSSMQQAMYHVDQNSAQAFPYGYQSTQQMSLPSPNGAPNRNEHHFLGNPMNGTGIRRNPGIPLPLIDGFLDPMTQMSNLWEDDLQSIVQMGITQNQSQNVPTGSVPNAQMKVEL